MIASTFAIVYLFLIFEIVFSSTKTIMYKQQAFEGRLLFFIYSLIVYYKGIRLNIFLWDTFVNEPIIQAYQLLDTFLTNFFGITIANDPWAIFLFLMPASFVYHFTNYWFQYGFGDNRIAKMVSFLAVVVYLSSGGFGLIRIISSPFLIISDQFVGVESFTGMPIMTFLISLTIRFLPTADMTTTIMTGGISWFAGWEPWMARIVFGVLIAILSVALYAMCSALMIAMAEAEFSTKRGFLALFLFPLIAFFVSIVAISITSAFLYGNFFSPVIGEKMWQVSIILLVLAGLAILAEIIVFAAIYAMMKNLRTAFGS